MSLVDRCDGVREMIQRQLTGSPAGEVLTILQRNGAVTVKDLEETMRVTAELSSFDDAAWPFSSMSGSEDAMVARLVRCVTLLVLAVVAAARDDE